MSQVKVTVYTTKVCPYCVAAKQLLSRRGVTYEEVDVSDDHAKRQWLAETSGQRTVPQIFFGDRPIGGFSDLQQLDAESGLEAALVAASEA